VCVDMAPLSRLAAAYTAVLLSSSCNNCISFLIPSPPLTVVTRLNSAVVNGSPDAPKTIDEDNALQWEMFTRHHALDGEWMGTWSTYNYMGDLEDSTVAGVSLKQQHDDDSASSVVQTHRILTSSTTSDCETCYSSSQFTTLPTIATYTPQTLGRRHRCAAVGMVIGPTVLPKSGTMSTELVLRHGNGRLRVTFQHAPVWSRDVEPGSCPPQGLKLFRTIVSKEKLRRSRRTTMDDDDDDSNTIEGPPNAAEEISFPPTTGNPKFFRPVPPYKWWAKWAGTSWTWDPQTGDRGWSIAEIDEADSWHGRNGDADGVWSLRLPGGVLLQCPRVIIGGVAGLCRLAWMPEDDGIVGTVEDGNKAKLLRIEASVIALEPIISDDNDDMMIGFYPPTLGSLRTDILEKIGELEGASLEERAKANVGYVWNAEEDGSTENIMALERTDNSMAQTVVANERKASRIDEDPRNSLDF